MQPLRLASWSTDNFTASGETSATRADGYADSLTGTVTRRLTYNMNVTVRLGNLISAQPITTALGGFANNVYMASGEKAQSSATPLFTLNRRTLDSDGKGGVAARSSFLSFGRLPQNENHEAELTIG